MEPPREACRDQASSASESHKASATDAHSDQPRTACTPESTHSQPTTTASPPPYPTSYDDTSSAPTPHRSTLSNLRFLVVADAPKPPSPHLVLCLRLALALRLLAPVAGALAMGVGWVASSTMCDAARAALVCVSVTSVLVVEAIVSFIWHLAVSVSLMRTLRLRPGLPFFLHANLAIILAMTFTYGLIWLVPRIQLLSSWDDWHVALLIACASLIVFFAWLEVLSVMCCWRWTPIHSFRPIKPPLKTERTRHRHCSQ